MKLSSSHIKRSIPGLLFLAIASAILWGFQDMLFTAHLRTPFISGELFWNTLPAEPFGTMRWIGCWLTQFAYYPILAILIYIIMWGIGYFLLDRSLRLPEKLSALIMLPFACLLLGITSVGYWIYIMKDFGFFFSNTAAFLCVLVLLRLLCRTTNMIVMVWGAMLIAMLYPVLGWYVLLLSVCLMILLFREFSWNVLYFIFALASPSLWQLEGVSEATKWIGGFPLFIDANQYSLRPSAPFIVLAVIMVVLCVISAIFARNNETLEQEKVSCVKKSSCFWLTTIVVAIISFFGVRFFSFNDYNYQAEMRMNKMTVEEDWNAVLKEAQKAETLSRSMVLLKNIALMNVGQLGDRSFKMSNDGCDIYNPDNIQLNTMQIVAPTAYFNFGQFNYTIRWSIEFAVGYGYSPYLLTSMIRAAKVTGEENLVQRYMKLLRGHLFYGDWKPRPASPFAMSLGTTYDDELDSDNNNIERFLIQYFTYSYTTNNPVVRDLCLFHSMLYRNPDFFWNAFLSYMQGNMGKPLPLHYQEGYLSFMNLKPVKLPFDVKIDPQVQQSFQTFLKQYGSMRNQGFSDEEIGAAMKPKWAKTYWWHILFGRNTY